MSKYLLTFLAFLFCFTVLHCQRLKKIVLKDFQDKEFTVFTKNFDELNVSKNLVVTYKDSLFTVNPEEIQKLAIDNITYESHLISTNKSVFLRCIEKGKINLYLYQYSNPSFEAQDPAIIMEEIQQDFYIEIQGQLHKIDNTNYKLKLQSFYPSIEILPSETFNDLTTIIARFND